LLCAASVVIVDRISILYSVAWLWCKMIKLKASELYWTDTTLLKLEKYILHIAEILARSKVDHFEFSVWR